MVTIKSLHRLHAGIPTLYIIRLYVFGLDYIILAPFSVMHCLPIRKEIDRGIRIALVNARIKCDRTILVKAVLIG